MIGYQGRLLVNLWMNHKFPIDDAHLGIGSHPSISAFSLNLIPCLPNPCLSSLNKGAFFFGPFFFSSCF